jgi:hypothetical protein
MGSIWAAGYLEVEVVLYVVVKDDVLVLARDGNLADL